MDWGKYNGCLDAPETLAGVGFRRAFVEVLTDCSATLGCAVLCCWWLNDPNPEL